MSHKELLDPVLLSLADEFVSWRIAAVRTRRASEVKRPRRSWADAGGVQKPLLSSSRP